MSNLRGPRERVRRLYATVVHSVALYRTLVWAESVTASRPLRDRVIQLQRASLNKVATTYRNIAAKVACLLTGTPPLDLPAIERLVLYREGSRGGMRRARLRRELHVRTVNNWQTHFGDGRKRYGGEIVCWFCGAPEDDVEHTIAECPMWDEHRQRLRGVIGPDLSIRGLVDALLREPRKWSAISRFSEAVLRTKEDREREHEKEFVVVRFGQVDLGVTKGMNLSPI